MIRTPFVKLALFLLVAKVATLSTTNDLFADDAARAEYFEKHIRPILINRCYECHSAETKTSEGNLLLDSKPAMEKGGTRGNTVDLKDGLERSLVWQAVNYENVDLQMPPSGKLPAEEIEHLRAWLADGAYDPRMEATLSPTEHHEFDAKSHWAYQRPQPESVARDPEDQWSRDSIDEMVFRRLKSKGLSPNPEADDRTLVRRLYYDVVGLPPTHEAIQAFVASRASTRYEELVDELLASPAFGERMARRWMDVVRYADTKGYVFQEEQRYKSAYQYRDWLITAFNSDMPYEQFLKYQIAADAIDPNNENGHQAAMGMLTLGRRFLNNPNDIADDRIDVVTRGTMAISVICARCHDHKYDPIQMADYYSLHSAFVNSHEPNSEQAPLALVDKAEIGPAVIFKRGNAHARGDVVEKKFVKFISLSKEYPLNRGSGRLDLAEAIVDPANPLTSRTIVNRVWGWVTSANIVSTPSDFGVRCPPPVHQDVLDQLASDFARDGWSVKQLVRRILLSSTYRMSSAENPTASATDPTNELWWKANRRRMDFESLRDAMLATTGHLDLTVGGDSVPVLNAPYSGRRTVYAFIDRLDLPGIFRAFDFANPDTHVAQRSLTTVPQQGLFLLNNEFVVDVAERFAAKLRSSNQESNSTDELIQKLYRAMYFRDPTPAEVQLATSFLQRTEVSLPEQERTAWRYGVGSWDGEPRTVTAFRDLPHFSEGQWKGGQTLPDAELGWCSHTNVGGHPDATKTKAAVRRWTAPEPGLVTVRGTLKHMTDQGDGVELFIAHNQTMISSTWKALNGEQSFDVNDVEVKAGDTIDFVVDSGPSIGHDSFQMKARIRYADERSKRFNSERDFSGPPPTPMSDLGQLVQAIIASNEFTFID